MTSKDALERYYSNLQYGCGGFQNDNEELEALMVIEKDIDRLEKLEKVIEILKNKWIDVGMVVHLIQCDNDTPEYYNEGLQKEYKLTQEEYELLKGVFEDE